MDIPLPAEPATNWELLSRTAPDQFVAALRAGAGDAPTLDFIYSFVAVRKRESSKDIHWSRLVDAGVIDALCECVIHAKTRPLDPISRSRWRIETSNSTSSTSSYYSFFEMLRSIAEKFSEPPSQVDLKVIQVLGTFWSQMMKRVWDRPEQSLVPSGLFVNERRIVAELLLAIIAVDTSFIGIIDEEPDLTVKVLSRYWIRSTTQRDAFINTAALAEMMEPQSKPIINYRKQHPLPPSFFDRIMLGGTSPGDFVSTIAKHLPPIYGIEGYMEVVLFESVWVMATERSCGAHTDLLRATRESSLLWSNLFSLLRRSAEDDQPDYTNKRNGLLVFPIIIKLAAIVIDDCADDLWQPPPESHVSLIKLWIAAGLWPALNEALTKGFIAVAEDDYQVTRSVVAIFRHFIYALKHNQSLLPLLSPCFPRPSLFMAACQMSKLVSTELKPVSPGEIPLDLDCGRWYWELQEACRVPDECSRRGCQHKITARCSTCKTGYCSVDCQRQDWKEHKLMCALKVTAMEALSKRSTAGSSSSTSIL